MQRLCLYHYFSFFCDVKLTNIFLQTNISFLFFPARKIHGFSLWLLGRWFFKKNICPEWPNGAGFLIAPVKAGPKKLAASFYAVQKNSWIFKSKTNLFIIIAGGFSK